MPLDFLSELEQKVDIILKSLEHLRTENKTLSEELSEKKDRIAHLEATQQQLQNEVDSLKTTNATNDSKLKSVAEKIQGLLARIEAV